MSSVLLGKKTGPSELLKLRDRLDSNFPEERNSAAKKTIALMRAGEDVGSLFSSMLRVVKTEDISLKRLVYYYLVTYSRQQPEQAIMVVNTFINDSEDFNPIVRALAVKFMCRIKLDTVAEYMIIPLKKCLCDPDAYVRKTAAMAVAKLYEVIPESVETSDLLSVLNSCLNDENPLVVSNAVMALLEINQRRETPMFVLNETNATPIISALTQCNDWVKTLLLDALSKYIPKTSEEAGFLIDRLIPLLKNANVAVVVSTFRCLLIYIEKDVRDKHQLFEKIIPPVVSLVGFAEPEVQFIVLRTLSLFILKYPKVLSKDVRLFFCKYNDPSYIKLEKLDIIVRICSPVNVHLVINELEEYCNSVDVGFVRKAIGCLGQICQTVQVAARRCVDVLAKQLDSGIEYSVEESVCVLCDILRSFPGEFESIISKVCVHLELLKKVRAKAGAIWILGEYSNVIDNVEVLLDPYVDSFGDEDPEVQKQILTAVVKIFIRNPEHNKDLIGYVLNEATKENVVPDVRNRALFLWRLLSTDQALTQEIVVFPKVGLTPENVTSSEDVLTELIQGAGLVSGVLHLVSSNFLLDQRYKPEEPEESQMSAETQETLLGQNSRETEIQKENDLLVLF